MNAPARNEIAAVVVLYNPSEEALGNIDSYAAQVGRVIAVDNSESPDAALHSALSAQGIEVVSMGGNEGIATALNVGCRRALESGYLWALTMDQDSTAAPEFISGLCEPLARAGSDTIAIVAPLWQQVGGLTEPESAEVVELDYAMTSGNLLRLAAFEALGGFRDELFIDQVDHEFCLRARLAGWRVVQKRDTVLMHRMGDLQEVRFPVHCFITDYSPLRRYYMVRNLLEIEREFGDSFPDFVEQQRTWWRQEFFKIVIAEPRRARKLLMMYRGWRDFRKRRFGRYDRLHSS